MVNHHKILKELHYERLAGTKGEEKAIEVITKYCRTCGLKTDIEAFDLTTFEPGSAKIEIEGRIYDATPFGLNASEAVEGELLFLENKEVININKNAYKDKIIISSGYSRKFALDLKKSGIKAYIAIGRPEREATSLSHRQKLHKEGYVPTVSVSYDEGLKLTRKSGKRVSITIDQQVHKKKAHNIIVTIPGNNIDNNLTYAVGHYDTVAHSPGASDNAGGTLALIKAAEYFSKHSPARDLKIIFFSGEELGLLGSQHYVKTHLDEVKQRAGMVLNVDVSGDPLGTDGMAVIGTKELMGYCDGLTREIGILYSTKLDIYSSDCMPFSVYEIPSVNIARFGGKASFHIHTSKDSIKNVSPRGYHNTIKTTIHLLKHILNAEIYPINKEIDSSLKDKIEKYIWNLAYEKPTLEWKPNYKK